MATKNLVPRATGEGQLGTTNKNWQHVFAVQGNFNQLKNTSNAELFVSSNSSTLTIAHNAATNQYDFTALGGGASTGSAVGGIVHSADGSGGLRAELWKFVGHDFLPEATDSRSIGSSAKKLANIFSTSSVLDTVDTDKIKFDNNDDTSYYEITLNGTSERLELTKYDNTTAPAVIDTNFGSQGIKEIAYTSDSLSLGESSLNSLSDINYNGVLGQDQFLITELVPNSDPASYRLTNKSVADTRSVLTLSTTSNVQFGTLKLTASDSNNNELGLDVVKPASFGDYTGNDAVIIDNGRGIYGKIANNSNIALTIGNNVNHKTELKGSLIISEINLPVNTALNINPDSNSTSNKQIDVSGLDIVGLDATPGGATSAASKAYVDSIAQGLSTKESVRAATNGNNIAGTYDNSLAAPTLTVTASGTPTFDGVTLQQNDRFLIKDQTNKIQNGIYTCTTVGDVNTQSVFTRSSDLNKAAQASGSFVFVAEGADNNGKGFVCNSPDANDTVGTDNLLFTGFSSAGQITTGNGITKNGSEISLDVTAGDGITISSVPSPVIAVDGVLAQLDGLSPLSNGSDDGKFIVATDANTFNYESGVTVRNSLGLGTLSNVEFTSLIAHGGVKSKNYKIYNNAADKYIELKTPLGNLNDQYTIQLPASKPSATNKVLSVSSLQGSTATLVWADQSGGTYTPPNNSNYLGNANSTSSADGLLDAKIKTNADNIGDNTTAIASKQDSDVTLTSLATNPNGENKFIVSTGNEEYAPKTAAQARTALGLGTAALETVGTDGGDVVQLITENGNVKLPALDGSKLTNVSASSALALDATPQLGGNLDLSGRTLFNSESNVYGDSNDINRKINSINLDFNNINLCAPKTGQNITNLKKFDSTKTEDQDTTGLFSQTGLSEGSLLTSMVRISDPLTIRGFGLDTDNSQDKNINGNFFIATDASTYDSLNIGDLLYLHDFYMNKDATSDKKANLSGIWMIHVKNSIGSFRFLYLTSFTPVNAFTKINGSYPTIPKELRGILRNNVAFDEGELSSFASYNAPSTSLENSNRVDTTNYSPSMTRVNINFIKTLNSTSGSQSPYTLSRKTYLYSGSNFGFAQIPAALDSAAIAAGTNKVLETFVVNKSNGGYDAKSIEIKEGLENISEDLDPVLGGGLNLSTHSIYSDRSDVPSDSYNTEAEYSTLYKNNLNDRTTSGSELTNGTQGIEIQSNSSGIRLWAANDKNIVLSAHGTGDGAAVTGKGLVHVPGTLKIGTSSLFLTEDLTDPNNPVATLKVPNGKTLQIIADDDGNNKGKVEIKGVTFEKDAGDNDNIKLSTPSGKVVKFASPPKIGEGTDEETKVPNKLTQNDKIINVVDLSTINTHNTTASDLGKDTIFVQNEENEAALFTNIYLPRAKETGSEILSGSYIKFIFPPNNSRRANQVRIRPHASDNVRLNRKAVSFLQYKITLDFGTSIQCIWHKEYIGTGTAQNPQGTWLLL